MGKKLLDIFKEKKWITHVLIDNRTVDEPESTHVETHSDELKGFNKVNGAPVHTNIHMKWLISPQKNALGVFQLCGNDNLPGHKQLFF